MYVCKRKGTSLQRLNRLERDLLTCKIVADRKPFVNKICRGGDDWLYKDNGDTHLKLITKQKYSLVDDSKKFRLCRMF